MANVKIKDATPISTVEDTNVMPVSDGGADALNISVGQIKEHVANGLGFETFSTSETYTAGKTCYYNGAIWRFVEDKSAGEWDETIVEPVDLADLNEDTKAKVAALEAQNGSETLTTDAQTLSGAVNELDANLGFVYESFGKYDTVGEVTLSLGVSGKYVSVEGVEVSNASYGISNTVNLNMGDILLVPSVSAVAAECSVVSQKAERTYQKVISYTYTYNGDGAIATATDTNRSKTYTFVYDEEGVLTDITLNGSSIGSLTLPTTYEVTENFYVPLVRQSVAAMPSAGYYVYLAPQNMTVVVSAFTATVNGGVCKKVGWGIFKNIASNFVGALAQRTIAEAMGDLDVRVSAIELGLLRGISALKVEKLDVVGTLNAPVHHMEGCVLRGTSSPSMLPTFVGQMYVNTDSKVAYIATGIGATTDWKQITNA